MTQLRILVVDDFPDATEVIGMYLGVLGHDCRTAMTGTDALAIAAEYAPTVAILDVGLPDLSGYEVARELRRLAAGRPLYLAAITGWGQVEDRVKALAAGFDSHHLKPADAAVIRGILEAATAYLAASTVLT